MRFTVVTKLGFTVLSALLAALSFAQTPPGISQDGLIAARRLFRQGDFQGAAAAFERMLEGRPSPELYAGLVQSFLKLDDVKSAEEYSRKALEAFPQSALAHATRGDAYFRRGLLALAESEYKSALKIDEACARAWLGRGKMEASLMRRSQAQESVTRAHELDADDGDALYEWAVRQPYPQNVAALEKHLAEFHVDPELEGHERDYKELVKALAGRPVWILDPDVSRSQLKLETVTAGPGLGTRGYGLRVRFNDRAEVTLLLDTGASGVTITRKFAEKVGARRLSDTTMSGVGRGGAAHGYQAWVDKIVIGGLVFHDCFVHVAPDSVAGLDGVIGSDVFEKFLVIVDFPARKLLLEPLPPVSPGDDPRVEDALLSRAFAFGHFLLLETQAGEKINGLFAIDSGANLSSIAQEPARRLGQMRPLNTTVTGMSGGTNSAFVADNVAMQFGKTTRRDQRIITVDLHSISKNLGTEISGLIGFNTLESMKLVIDYRDGLVGFEGSH
jgi:predicted aspartyl protease